MVDILLSRQVDSLPSGTRIVSGFREDFLRGVGKLGAPLSERASSFQIEADVPLHAWKVLVAAQARTKRGKPRCPQGDSAGLAC